jgi:hypothetical protein
MTLEKKLAYGQYMVLGRLLLCVVDPEEVGIQNSLNDTSNNRNRVEEPRDLEEIPVNPIGDIQRPVRAKRKEIMGRNRLGFARPLEHKELRKNSYGFKPDGKSPQDLTIRVSMTPDSEMLRHMPYLDDSVLVWEQNRQDRADSY